MSEKRCSDTYELFFNQRLIDAIPAPVFIQDQKRKFLGVNRAFLEFFAIDQELFCLSDFYGLLDFETAAKSREVDTMIFAHGGEESFEATMKTPGNIERAVIFHKASITGENGEVVGLVTTLFDLTKQRKTELQLRHAQKMEAIGTLAGGIAHDFNNVLTPIVGYAEIMRLMALREGEEDSLSMQYIGEFLSAAKRAKSLVEQILTFSRSREKKALPQYLHPIVKEVLTLIRATLPTSIEIRQEIDEECGMVSIDPVQLHQVLLNLCTNSAQAIGEGQGRLSVRLAKGARDRQGREWVELSVADSGSGIDPEIQERVFEPYFTTKEKSQGTGMGLAMVHGIVTRYGGRIELKSEKGKGTVFHVLFPCVMPQTIVTQAKDPLVHPTGNEHVLVVDDQAAVLKVTSKILETLGYTVTACSLSREALAVFSCKPDAFDLIITDLTMPSLTGLEICREVKKIRKTIPVILSSGYGEKLSGEKLRAAGFAAWFTKPVTLEKLAYTVRTVLDESQLITDTVSLPE